MRQIFALLIAPIFLNVAAAAQVASGGGYTLDQSVIASGGGSSSGGAFLIVGTSGQSAAGGRPTGPAYNAQNGFWTATPLAPSAAEVEISGQVMTAAGAGIRNAFLTIHYANGTSRTAVTGSFGYFKLIGIEAGQTVVISVISKRYRFAQPSLALNISESVSDLRFVANE